MNEIFLIAAWYGIGLFGSYVGCRILNNRYPNTEPERWNSVPYLLVAIAGPINLIVVFLALGGLHND